MGGRDLISFFVLFKIAAFTCAVHLIQRLIKPGVHVEIRHTRKISNADYF